MMPNKEDHKMSKVLYHYTLQKEDGLWDCISESIPKGAEFKDLEQVHKFEWCIKRSFENGAPYMGVLSSDKRKYGFYLSRWKRVYDRYFREEMKLENCLSDNVRERFSPEQSGKSTSGYEFSSGKFYSVASSSRFAVASFTKEKDGKLDYIESIKINGKEERISEVEFEHDTPVNGIDKNSHSPQLDFFFKTDNGTYFIEAKSHEILNNYKSIELSPSYLKTDAFKKLGLKEEPRVREYTDSNDKVHQYISLDKSDDDGKHLLYASDFGCNLKTFHFDFKQFLCHLMGIWSYAKEHQGEEIYFYYLIYRNKLYEEMFNSKLYQELEEEMRTIFTDFGKRFPIIHFGLCYHDKYDTLKGLNLKELL